MGEVKRWKVLNTIQTKVLGIVKLVALGFSISIKKLNTYYHINNEIMGAKSRGSA